MRILLITSDKFPLFRPAAAAIFGGEMARLGHTVDGVLQAERSTNQPATAPYGKGTLFIGPTDDGQTRLRRLNKYRLDILNDLRIFRLVKHNHYDIIQVKDRYFSALLGWLASRLVKKPFCYWLAYPHAESNIYVSRQGIARYKLAFLIRGYLFKVLLYRFILPAADHVFVQSEQMKRDLHEKGVPLDKMTPVPGSVDINSIPYGQRAPHDAQREFHDEKRIVYLGTLGRERKLTFLVRALFEVRKEIPNAKLYLLGKGKMPEDEQSLRDEAERLGLGQMVIFAGFLPMEEAWNYIRDADVCVSPYYPTPILNSTSPTKLIEYMAMARPVVGNDHPEQTLVINESRAGIVTPWDEVAFAKAIVKILANPVEAEEMGQSGRRYVEMYRTNSVLASMVIGQYQQILNGRQHA